MNNLVEILLGIIIIFLVVGQPKMLAHFTYTTIGKLLFLAATIAAGYKSLIAGMLVAIIYIIIRKDYMLIENMDNISNKTDFIKKHCEGGKLKDTSSPPPITFLNDKCNPCDNSCEFEITDSSEQLTVDEALRPKESNTIPV